MAEKIGAYTVLVGRPEEEGPHVRPKRRWEGNIEIGLLELG